MVNIFKIQLSDTLPKSVCL